MGNKLLFPEEFQEDFRECSQIAAAEGQNADIWLVSGVLSGIRFLCELFIKFRKLGAQGTSPNNPAAQTSQSFSLETDRHNNAMKWNGGSSLGSHCLAAACVLSCTGGSKGEEEEEDETEGY